MCKQILAVIALCSGLFLASVPSEASNPGNTTWFNGPLERALDLAKKEKKPVFVYFSAHWCVPCLALKSQLFPDPDFEALMKNQYIPFYMDFDAPGSQGWMDKYKIGFIPQMVVISPDGQELMRPSSTVPPKKIIEILQGSATLKRSLESIAADALADKPQTLADEEWKLLLERVNTGSTPLLKNNDDTLKALGSLYQGMPAEKKDLREKMLLALLNAQQSKNAESLREAQSLRKDFDALFDNLEKSDYPDMSIDLINLMVAEPKERTKYYDRLLRALEKWREKHKSEPSFQMIRKRLNSLEPIQVLSEESKKPLPPNELAAFVKNIDHETQFLDSLTPLERDVVAIDIAYTLLWAKQYEKARAFAKKEFERKSDQKDKFVSILARIAQAQGDKQGSKKLRFEAYDLVPGRSSKFSQGAGILGDAANLDIKGAEFVATLERILSDYFKNNDSVEGWDTYPVSRIIKDIFASKDKLGIDWKPVRERMEQSCNSKPNCLAIAQAIGVSEKLPQMVAKQIVNLSLGLYNKTHLGVYFENQEGWHTYAKKRDQIALPIGISSHSGSQVLAADAIEGWPATMEFTNIDGKKATGYGGRYGFFISLSDQLRSFMQSADGVRIDVKWLACKDICIPGTSSMVARLSKDGVLTTEPAGFAVTPAEATQWFAQTTPGTDSQSPSEPEGFAHLLLILALALLGGFILNFMPCVLPVISIKLFSLVKHRGESRSVIAKHSLAYTAGVLVSFLALALGVIALKMTGASVGWGFQLQSPLFVAGMILVVFVMMLSFFGLFEFKALGANFLTGKLDRAERSERYSETFGSFGNGLLATLLATPCSAPFLGTALAFAFLASPGMIILIFLFVGLGLSAPFLAIAAFPSMLRILPKPGAWMENLRRVLGLFLGITLVWLIDVYTSLSVGPDRAFWLTLTLLFTFFAIYGWQRMTKSLLGRLLLVALFAGSLVPLLRSFNEPEQVPLLTWQKWSPEAQAQAALDGRKVFIDFTAEWCITCKYNEKLFLETASFADLVKRENVLLMKADYTKSDKTIADFLQAHGKPGVPAYFVQTPQGSLIDLGSLLTPGKIEDALTSPATPPTPK